MEKPPLSMLHYYFSYAPVHGDQVATMEKPPLSMLHY